MGDLWGAGNKRHPASEPVILTWICVRCPSSSTACPPPTHVDRGREVPDDREFPRGTFSQAELTGERVITRCITRSLSVPGATIRAMPGDPGRLPAPASPAAPGAGPAAVAGELLGRARAELPAGWGAGAGLRASANLAAVAYFLAAMAWSTVW